MMSFDCDGAALVATLDEGAQATGLLIVSGGNEIRSGAHAGQAALAAHCAKLGYPVFRYDRRGVGDSEGVNGGFESSAADIAAAATAFREAVPGMQRLVAFGNCDAATALALFHGELAIDRLVLANPWVIETPDGDQTGDEGAETQPSAAAIRARYWNRIKNPRSLLDLVTGKIDLRKLASGLARAAQAAPPSGLAAQLAAALSDSKRPVHLLVAERDTTALAFLAAWNSPLFASVRARGDTALARCATASHSFADAPAREWLRAHLEAALKAG